MTVNTTDYTFVQPTTKKPTHFPNSVQLRYEIEHVRQCLKKGSRIFICLMYLSVYKINDFNHFFLGLIESPVVTLNNSYTVQEILDQLRKQIGVEFEEDVKTTNYNV